MSDLTEAELDVAAQNYLHAQLSLATAQAAFDTAKANFIRAFEAEYGDVGTYAASDGNTYGRTYRSGKTTFDFDGFVREFPDLAEHCSKTVVDGDALMKMVEEQPELQPLVQKYTKVADPTVAMLPVVQTKEEEPDDE